MAKQHTETRKAVDGFTPDPGSDLFSEHDLLGALLNDHTESWRYQYLDLKDPVVSHIRGLKPQQQCRIIHAALERLEFAERTLRETTLETTLSKYDSDAWLFGEYFCLLIDVVLRKRLPIDDELLMKLLKWGADNRPFDETPPGPDPVI